ncbi:hypothetical protein [Natronolimnohabitans innermongolicus]|uniref:hypothetical protein n=1 Tax=Natronolimnohabitans innermongolicus TaxID=253107 RepID=UPI001375CF80|nr:hypothetical protein [Natronolimnohabitans innermongolicus]
MSENIAGISVRYENPEETVVRAERLERATRAVWRVVITSVSVARGDGGRPVGDESGV